MPLKVEPRKETGRLGAVLAPLVSVAVTVVAGRGAAWDPAIGFRPVPRVDSRHPDVLAVKSALDEGRVIYAA